MSKKITSGRVAFNVVAVFLVLATGLALSLGLGERAGTTPSTAETYSQYARIKATTAMIPIGMGSAVYVSFQTETPDGRVVMTQGGSDSVNMNKEDGQLWQTPKRRAMVDSLRAKMQDAGWTELGVDGQWFEYVFGR